MKIRNLLLIMGSVVAVGCGHLPSVSGTYSGKLQSSSGEAMVHVTITEVRQALSGTAQASGLEFMPRSYYVIGSQADNGTVELEISLNYVSGNESGGVIGACAYHLVGSGDRAGIAGTYSTHGCANGSTGTFALTAQ